MWPRCPPSAFGTPIASSGNTARARCCSSLALTAHPLSAETLATTCGAPLRPLGHAAAVAATLPGQADDAAGVLALLESFFDHNKINGRL